MKLLRQLLILCVFFFIYGKVAAQIPQWNTNGACTGADPSLQSIMINSCGIEVYTEFFIFNTGTSSFDPSGITVQGSNGVPGSPPIVTGYTGSHPDMTTMLAKLNSWTGCGGVFVAAPALIPPNSQVMAFNAGFNGATGLGSISPAPNLSSYCGKTIYVVAASYPGAADIFKNSQSAGNALIIKFGACHTTVNYGVPFPQTDGAYLTCGSNGTANYNTAIGCFMPACTVPTATASISTGPCLSAGQDISLDLVTNAGAGATIMWSGPNGFSSSSQNPVHTSPGLAAGTYTYNVKVAQPGGCFKMTSVNVTIGQPLNFTALPDLTVCGTTAIPLAVTGTVPPVASSTYQWSGVGISSNTSATPTATSPLPTSPTTSLITTYSVTVTEPTGCFWVDEFNVTTLPSVPIFNVTTPITICSGQPVVLSVTSASINWNGVITVPSGSNPKLPYNVQFSWSGNSFTSNTTTDILPHNVTIISAQAPITPGNYIYTLNSSISNSNNHPSCAISPTNVTVTVQSSGTITYTTADLCSGQSLNLNTLISAPSPVPAGTWSGTGVTASNFNPSSLAAGAYNVTFTPSSAACLSSGSTTVNVKALPVVATSQTGSLCGSSSPYSGTVTLNATSGFTTYQWSSGVTGSGNSVTVNNTGTYTLTVTDINGCTTVKTYNVTANPNPTVAITAPASLCVGSIATLTLNNTFSNYLWSDNSTTNSLSITGPGSYSVTVSNSNGCTATDSKTIAAATPLSPTILPFGKICGTGSVTLSLSNIYSNYLWSNGINANSITVTSSGNYSVTVSDINGCKGEASIFVQQFLPPNVTITGNLILCGGANTTLSTIPNNFSSYLWSNNSTNSTINITQPSNYSVTVTDVNGCQGVDNKNVVASATLTPTFLTFGKLCSNGNVVISLSNTYSSYTWSNGAKTESITVTNSGIYAVTVSNAAGCKGSASIVIQKDGEPDFMITGALNVCNVSSSILATNPSNFNQYKWSTGSSNSSINVSQSGTYSVTIIDTNGCSASKSVIYNNYPLPKPEIIGDTSVCFGKTTNLTVGGGSFSIYSWSNSSSANSINVGKGIHSVTVTDSNGCKASISRELKEEAPVLVSILGNLSICNNATTTLSTEIYKEYSWSNGEKTQTIQAAAGNYSITVTNEKGCQGTASVLVNQFSPLNVITTNNSPLCPNETLTFLALGGTTYAWSGPNGFTSNQQNPSIPKVGLANEGVYSVTATSSNGCTAEAKTTVKILPAIQTAATCNSPVCKGSTVYLLSLGGTAYKWSGPDGFQSTLQNPILTNVDIKNAGTYTVTVSDGTNCANTASTILVVENCMATKDILAKAAIQLFPNPVKEQLTIQSNLPIFKVVLSNSIGQEVLSQKFDNETIMLNIEKFPKGVYFAKVYLDEKTFEVFSVVKE